MRNTFTDILAEILVILTVIILVFSFIFGIIQSIYFIKSKLYKATGTVYCDNKTWSGDLYKVRSELATQNLQAPMFRYAIHHPVWYFVIEESGFCKDFRIEAK